MSLLLDTSFLYAFLNRTDQNHERVLTLDVHFAMFRPSHCDAFELLP